MTSVLWNCEVAFSDTFHWCANYKQTISIYIQYISGFYFNLSAFVFSYFLDVPPINSQPFLIRFHISVVVLRWPSWLVTSSPWSTPLLEWHLSWGTTSSRWLFWIKPRPWRSLLCRCSTPPRRAAGTPRSAACWWTQDSTLLIHRNSVIIRSLSADVISHLS